MKRNLKTEETTVLDTPMTNAGFVTLPFDHEGFNEFICSMLGKPQSIDNRFYGRFEIDLNTINDIHQLIEQRITQQNAGLLVQFQSKIYYEDNSSVTLTSYQQLVTYREIRPAIPFRVELTWIYLVKFQDKKVPEKQEIQLTFKTKDYARHYSSKILIRLNDGGCIDLSIKHTARTWGVDIESLLTNFLKNIIKSENKIRKFLIDNDPKITLIAGSIIFISTLIGIYIISKDITYKATTIMSKYLSNVKLTTDDRIVYLAKYLVSGNLAWLNFWGATFVVIAFIVAVTISIWITSSISNISEPSFILLTKEANEKKQKYEKRKNNELVKIIIAFIVGILSSLVATYIYQLIVSKA